LPLERELDRLYATRFSESDRRSKSELWKVLYESFFRKYHDPQDTVLDVGAGYCDFINQVRSHRRIAVDVNPDTAGFAATGVQVHTVPLQEMRDFVENDSVDLAFASNVFEHLRSPEALLEVLASIRAVLKPGGRLIVMQPNVRCVGGKFWDFFDHTLPLTDKGMVEALTLSEFEVTENRPRFLPYTTKSRAPQWPILIRAYLAFPPAQWVFGEQMLVVARRPSER